MHAPPDAIPRVHVHPWHRSRPHARLPRPARRSGARLHQARAAIRPRLRARGVPRLLDLSQRRRRNDASAGAPTRTRSRSADAIAFPRPCWYRYFWERQGYEWVGGVDGLLRLCGDFSGLQRAGCMGGASLLMARERESADHALICSRSRRRRTRSTACGASTSRSWRRTRSSSCGSFAPARIPAARAHRCYAWFGKTLDGGHRRPLRRGRGARTLNVPDVRAACVAGARRADEAARHVLLSARARREGRATHGRSHSRLRASRAAIRDLWRVGDDPPAPVRVATTSSNSVAGVAECESPAGAELIGGHSAGNACDGERQRRPRRLPARRRPRIRAVEE